MLSIGGAAFCGAISVVLGMAYLLAAGAPRAYLLINAAALTFGVALAGLPRWLLPRAATAGGGLTLAAGTLVLGTAWFGTSLDGASRWIVVGGLALQPSVVVLPAAIVCFASRPSPLAALGLAIGGIGLGLQPDRAMAGTLVVGLFTLFLARPERSVMLALLAAIAGAAAAFLQADTLPPVAYVEGVVQSAFALHPLAGVLVATGLVVMLLPAITRRITPHAPRDAAMVFGTTWLTVIAFAIIGHYPTPLVGYGSSAIVGYCLCAIALD